MAVNYHSVRHLRLGRAEMTEATVAPLMMAVLLQCCTSCQMMLSYGHVTGSAEAVKLYPDCAEDDMRQS
jgi:hypothetical protein